MLYLLYILYMLCILYMRYLLDMPRILLFVVRGGGPLGSAQGKSETVTLGNWETGKLDVVNVNLDEAGVV